MMDEKQRKEMTGKLEVLMRELSAVAPTLEDLRELLVFTFAGALEGLTPVEASTYLLRVTRLLDVGAVDLRAALDRGREPSSTF
jgi:hypothetical protein